MGPFKPVAASITSAINAYATADAAAAHGVDCKTNRRVLFPDDEHACHPLRRAQFAKLSKNALPPAPTKALHMYAQKQSPSKISASKQSHQKTSPSANASNNSTGGVRQHRIANPCDTDLWGFPVYFSPKREIGTQWERALAEHQFKPLNVPVEGEHNAATQTDAARILTKEDRERCSRRDYAQYLYFAAKYGPLDTLLYCCTPFPGHVYALLVEQSARKLQQWSRERVKALCNHWIARLSRELSGQWLDEGTQAVVQSFEHQQRAGAFLRRLQWLVAAKALRNWFAFTQMQIEVKWRFNFAAGQDLRARFQRWKQHVEAVKAFKKQLKSVARRKRMGGVFAQWQQWKTQQEQARQLLVRRWLKTQRDCFGTWCVVVKVRKHASRAACVIQSHWRGFRQRTQYQRQREAGSLTVRVARGWHARRRVRDLRASMAVGETLLQLTQLVAWKARCATLQSTRESLLIREIERATEEMACTSTGEAQALAFMSEDLDKVVRNQMHQRLQDKLKMISDSGEAAEDVRGNREKLIQFAREKLCEDVQRDARAQAIAQFRGLRSENLPLEDCLVCHAASMDQSDDSETERCTQRGSAHTCAHFSFSQQHQLATITSKLSKLREQEAAFEQELAEIPIPVLWRDLHLT